MPFFCLPSEHAETSLSGAYQELDRLTELGLSVYPYFTDRQSAHAVAKQESLIVRYVGTRAEHWAWWHREQGRFNTGQYRPCPWPDKYPNHYAHLSVKLEGMIAYTPDDESGYLDRQVRIKPGRYLEQFYADVPVAERQCWLKSASLPQGFEIATSPDDIETVYRHGPRSCMGPGNSFDYEHPTRAYGDSDLAVAFFGPKEKCCGRAVIWPEKKVYSKVYGDDRLAMLLDQAGYRRGNLVGARIRAIYLRDVDAYAMPYIDGISEAKYDKDTDGKAWLLLGDGDLPCDVTHGHTGDRRDESDCVECGNSYDQDDLRDGLCESCRDSRCRCERCHAVFFDSDRPEYCPSCENDRSYCEACESDTWDETYTAISARGYEINVCEDCATGSDSRFDCAICDTRAYEWQYSHDDQQTRRDNGTARAVCEDCEKTAVHCADCDTWRDGSAVPTCPDCADTDETDETTDDPDAPSSVAASIQTTLATLYAPGAWQPVYTAVPMSDTPITSTAALETPSLPSLENETGDCTCTACVAYRARPRYTPYRLEIR